MSQKKTRVAIPVVTPAYLEPNRFRLTSREAADRFMKSYWDRLSKAGREKLVAEIRQEWGKRPTAVERFLSLPDRDRQGMLRRFPFIQYFVDVHEFRKRSGSTAP